jgi:hypothetical protein
MEAPKRSTLTPHPRRPPLQSFAPAAALAAGRQAFSRLSAASYSSAAMRALLEHQGLGGAEPTRLELVASQQQAQALAGRQEPSPLRHGGRGRALGDTGYGEENYYSSALPGGVDAGYGRDVAEMVRTMGVLGAGDEERAALAALELEPDFDPMGGGPCDRAVATTALARPTSGGSWGSAATLGHGSALGSVALRAEGLAGASHIRGSSSDHAATYAAHFGAGLAAYGASGMTVLEELVDAAFRASDRAVAAGARVAHGAALLAAPAAANQGGEARGSSEAGGERTVFAASAVESASDPALSVSAERACLLKAVSEGRVEVEALVIASAHGDAFPVPDGNGRQFLAEYGTPSRRRRRRKGAANSLAAAPARTHDERALDSNF